MELCRALEIVCEMAGCRVTGVSFTAGEPLLFLAAQGCVGDVFTVDVLLVPAAAAKSQLGQAAGDQQ